METVVIMEYDNTTASKEHQAGDTHENNYTTSANVYALRDVISGGQHREGDTLYRVTHDHEDDTKSPPPRPQCE